jgi:HPt (histidine-containing phosphotransfer) domain-containing protein
MSDNPTPPNDPIPSELAQEDGSFVDLVEEFVAALPQRMEKMFEALRARDFESLRILAHQLKGSAGGYGYPTVTEHAAELEKHARCAEIDALLADMEVLRDMVARVVVRL